MRKTYFFGEVGYKEEKNNESNINSNNVNKAYVKIRI